MRESAVALGGVVFAAACCLAVPIAAALIGGAISVAVIGWGALGIATLAVAVLLIARARRMAGRRNASS